MKPLKSLLSDRTHTVLPNTITKAATAAIAEHFPTSTKPAIFLSGGMLSGYHHAYSDVDLYVVSAASSEPLLFRHGALVVQLNPVSGETMRRLVDLYSLDVSITAAAIGDHMKHRKLGSRLVTGSPLTAAASTCRLPHLASYRALEMAARSAQVARMLEDAAGSLAFGDLLMGTRAATQALEASLEVALASLGDLHFGEALLWRRLASSSIAEHLSTFQALSQPRGVSRHETIADIVRSSFVASRLCSWALLLNLHSHSSPRALPVDSILQGADSPIGSPFHTLIEGPTGASIVGLDRAFRVNQHSALAWLELECRPSSRAKFDAAGLTYDSVKRTLQDLGSVSMYDD